MDKSHAYKTWEEWFEAIDQYSETLKIRSRQRFEETEGIRLLTMHGAKGLEYDLVYIPDANQGIAPHKKCADRIRQRGRTADVLCGYDPGEK